MNSTNYINSTNCFHDSNFSIDCNLRFIIEYYFDLDSETNHCYLIYFYINFTVDVVVANMKSVHGAVSTTSWG